MNLAKVLPLRNKFAARINLAISYYQWKSFFYKIARDQLKLPIAIGGLGMVDIKQKCNALLLRQIVFARKKTGDEQDVVYWSRTNSPTNRSWLSETWRL